MSTKIDDFRVEVAPAVLDDLRDRLARTRAGPIRSPVPVGATAPISSTCATCARRGARRSTGRRRKRASTAGRTRSPRSTVSRCTSSTRAHPNPTRCRSSSRTGGRDRSPSSSTSSNRCATRAHGGDPADAFHVVCPSMPGYGWSGPTHESGWDVRRIAEAWKVLMARLGYERYGAQGGDWGSMVSSQLGGLDAEHVAGVHLNMVIGAPPRRRSSSAEAEQADLAAMGAFMEKGAAYQQIQGKNPQTLGYGLNDSPAGPRGLDRREVPRVDRSRRRPRDRGHARSDPHQPHRLLGDRHDQLVGAALLRVAAQRPLPAVREGRGAGRLRAVPRRDPEDAAIVGRDALQRHPLDPVRSRRSLRRARGARSPRSTTCAPSSATSAEPTGNRRAPGLRQ